MKAKPSLLFLCFVFSGASLQAQGTFQNLNFESATLPTLPSGQSGGFVPISGAIPNWSGYIATTPITQVLHNSLTLGSPNISMLGPNVLPVGSILEGQFTAVLQASTGPGGNFAASLAQQGTLPSDARSLQVRVNAGYPNPTSAFAVSFAGQSLALSAIGGGANYTLYAGDISGFAGQSGELRLTALPYLNQSATTIYFDSVGFSPNAVPEPGTWALLTLGGALLWGGVRRRRK